MTTNRPLSRITLWGIALTLGAIALIYALSSLLMPFVLAILLAYICHPTTGRLTRSWFPAALASLLVLLLLTGILVTFGMVIIPMLYHEFSQMLTRLPAVLNELHDWSVPWLQQTLHLDISSNLDQLREVLVQNMGSAEAALQKLLRSASDGSAFLASIAFTLLLVPVVFFYLLKDWSNIVQSLFSAVPIRHRALVSSVTGEIDSVLGQFLRGQLIVMLVMSVYYATALHVVGLDSGIPIGILTGCLVFIPYVGVFTGFVLAILTALVQGPGITLLLPVTIAFVLGHVLEGTVITPRLVGERIGLHPVMVIFSLLAFGKLLGFFGILIALPTTAALWIIIRRVNQTMSSESEIR